MFKYQRTDLPLEKDTNGRFLPWLIALMVFLTVISFGVLLALNSVASRWDSSIGNSISIQLYSQQNLTTDNTVLQKVLSLLAGNKDIRKYEVVSDQEIINLVKPWLGEAYESFDFPMPRLISVELVEGAKIDATLLEKQISDQGIDVSVDDHYVWLARFVDFVKTIQWVVLMILGFVLFALVGTVVFVTRTGLEVHREVIEVLHFIGAQDQYIARQFAGRAMVMSFRGALLGSALGTLALFVIIFFLEKIGNNFVIELHPQFFYTGFLIGLPVFVGLTARSAAHATVLWLLSRIP